MRVDASRSPAAVERIWEDTQRVTVAVCSDCHHKLEALRKAGKRLPFGLTLCALSRNKRRQYRGKPCRCTCGECE